MANEKNLVPLNQRTKGEQRRIASAGGKASASDGATPEAACGRAGSDPAAKLNISGVSLRRCAFCLE